MKLSAYLSPSRHGIYYFRWPLPLAEGRKRTSIRISLRTRCPDSRNTKPALKGVPLMEVINATGLKTISAKTINSHIGTFKRFFDWAERHGHSPHKLFEGVKVPKAKNDETARKPFTKEQTQLIYTELTENTSGIVRSESHKWGSLIGLFTGARLNEICQLDIADIQEDNGMWVFNITDEGDNKKRIKAKASKRKVPIHSELIRLGLPSSCTVERMNSISNFATASATPLENNQSHRNSNRVLAFNFV